MFNFIKTHIKFFIGAFVGAFLTVASMTATPMDDMVGKYLSTQTGITVQVSPTAVLETPVSTTDVTK